MFENKPIIGIAGGIGSGKSLVADLFSELSCIVINSDALVHQAYQLAEVKAEVARLLGPDILLPDGSIDRKVVARHIFSDPIKRLALEGYLHPLVEKQRDLLMAQADKSSPAFVWDTPLLFETGLFRKCDALVFVDCPPEIRLSRVRKIRGWNAEELLRRENLQWGLDKKQNLSHYIIVNTADADSLRSQVRDVLSQVLANP